MTKPLCIDLYSGLGGWAEGFLAEGFQVVGYDIVDQPTYPGRFVMCDVLGLDGRDFVNAAVIVASPPCQEFSFTAMPWKIAKAQKPEVLPAWWDKPEPKMSDAEMAEWKAWKAEHPATPPNTELFDACFRIQREASEAAGHHVPMVVENVKGAQPWVGRARWHYGSYYLWGDVPALMPSTKTVKIGGARGDDWFVHHGTPEFTARANKNSGDSWFAVAHNTESGHSRNPVTGEGSKRPGVNLNKGSIGFNNWPKDETGAYVMPDGTKVGGSGAAWFDKGPAALSSRGAARKAASALIAKIPFRLAQYIASTYRHAAEST